MVGPAIPTGDAFCMVGPQADDAAVYRLGWNTLCTVAAADTPPISAMQMTKAQNYCSGVLGGQVVPSCPRDNLVAYCTGRSIGSMSVGLETWTLIYQSKVTPDPETVAANQLENCGGGQLWDAAGNSLARVCKGTMSLKVDGKPKVFSRTRLCSWTSDGDQAEFHLSAFTLEGDLLTLVVHKQNGIYDFGKLSAMSGASYVEVGGKAFVLPTDPAAAMLLVTKFEGKGAALAATFSPGTVEAAGESRTLTEGVVDIQIVAP
jgi:hypothetical protein